MRLPNLRKADLDEEHLQVWEQVCRVRGAETVNEGGGLVGPFNSFVHAPNVGSRLLELGNALHARTTLPMRTTELVILTVGAHWRAEFEWWAHARRALESGVPDVVVEAIGAGATPDFEDDADRVIHALARQLVDRGRIEEDTYEAVRGVVGDRGMVELVSLCGYYTLISFLLNGFDVQLPLGQSTRWAHATAENSHG